MSPFLKIGTMWAIFQLLGNLPILNDILNIFVNTGVIAGAAYFKSLLPILSGPVDFVVSSFNKTFFTSWEYIVKLLIYSFGYNFFCVVQHQ